ncbi:MAG: hypothetical protein QXT93_10560 [Thermofilum sp.]
MIAIDASALTKHLLREPGFDSVGKHLLEGTYLIDHMLKQVSNAVWGNAAIHRKPERAE